MKLDRNAGEQNVNGKRKTANVLPASEILYINKNNKNINNVSSRERQILFNTINKVLNPAVTY